jgi:hypothetical protein
MRIQRMRTGISFSLADGDRDRLNALVADRNSPQKQVWRARIVLLSAAASAQARSWRQPAAQDKVVRL